MDSVDKKAPVTVQRLAQAGMSELEIKMIYRFCRWTSVELRREQETVGWESRMLLDARSREADVVAERATRHMTSMLSSGASAFASMSTLDLAALCKDDRLRQLCLRYDPDMHGGRLVCGPTGTGKTAAGAAVVRRITAEPYARWMVGQSEAERGLSPSPAPRSEWVRAFDLANARLQARFGEGEAEAVQRLKGASFLVIDDLGWESKRGNADDVVVEVIAERYDAGRATYVTSGLKEDTLISRYGDAVVRKILDAGGKDGRVVDLWESTR